MRAVLLAAGLGSRLRPLTDTVPKCLAPIQGRPLLDIWLETLVLSGIGPVLVNTHHLADKVEQYVAESRYRDVVTLVHEPELLGTAGTLKANRDFLRREAVLLAHADNLCVCNFSLFVQAHSERSVDTCMTMMTFRTDTPQTCGIVEIDGRGVVTAFHEKAPDPPGNLANGAVYLLEPEVLDFIARLERAVADFSTEVLPHFIGRIQTWHNASIHRDIGTESHLRLAQIDFAAATEE